MSGITFISLVNGEQDVVTNVMNNEKSMKKESLKGRCKKVDEK